VVRNSLRTMQQTTTGNEAARFLSRAAFRTIGRLPPVEAAVRNEPRQRVIK
jgi:hypothetical protein